MAIKSLVAVGLVLLACNNVENRERKRAAEKQARYHWALTLSWDNLARREGKTPDPGPAMRERAEFMAACLERADSATCERRAREVEADPDATLGLPGP